MGVKLRGQVEFVLSQYCAQQCAYIHYVYIVTSNGGAISFKFGAVHVHAWGQSLQDMISTNKGPLLNPEHKVVRTSLLFCSAGNNAFITDKSSLERTDFNLLACFQTPTRSRIPLRCTWGADSQHANNMPRETVWQALKTGLRAMAFNPVKSSGAFHLCNGAAVGTVLVSDDEPQASFYI